MARYITAATSMTRMHTHSGMISCYALSSILKPTTVYERSAPATLQVNGILPLLPLTFPLLWLLVGIYGEVRVLLQMDPQPKALWVSINYEYCCQRGDVQLNTAEFSIRIGQNCCQLWTVITEVRQMTGLLYINTLFLQTLTQGKHLWKEAPVAESVKLSFFGWGGCQF